MQCKEKYYATSGSCVECTGVGLPSWLVKAVTYVLQQQSRASGPFLWRLSFDLKFMRKANMICYLIGPYKPCCILMYLRFCCFVLFHPPPHPPQVSIGALLAAFLVAIAFFVYSWSPSQWLTRAIFAPGALGDWQQQLVKRQVPCFLFRPPFVVSCLCLIPVGMMITGRLLPS